MQDVTVIISGQNPSPEVHMAKAQSNSGPWKQQAVGTQQGESEQQETVLASSIEVGRYRNEIIIIHHEECHNRGVSKVLRAWETLP